MDTAANHKMTVLSAAVRQPIDSWCEQTLAEMQARSVVVLTQQGHVLATVGQLSHQTLPMLAGLVAATFAAGCALHRYLGSSQLTSISLENNQLTFYLAVCGNANIVGIAFDQHSSLGLVRLLWARRQPQLEALLNQVMTTAPVRWLLPAIDVQSLPAAATVSAGQMLEVT